MYVTQIMCELVSDTTVMYGHPSGVSSKTCEHNNVLMIKVRIAKFGMLNCLIKTSLSSKMSTITV